MDLSTSYLGMTLRNPIVASAGPLAQTLDGVRALADGGVGAIVLHSLFEEQLRAEVAKETALIEDHAESFAEALNYFPSTPMTTKSAAFAYLALVERASKAVDVPVIASLNGADEGGWVQFAHELEEAGAAALELNTYFVPGDLHTPGVWVTDRHVDILAAVKDAIDIPVSIKMSPYFSSPGYTAMKILEAGADGLVLFNRFLQPDIDIETLEMTRDFALSNPDDGRLARTWLAVLRNHTEASLAGSTGVETADDVVRYLLAGADVVMTTASLIRNGPGHARVLVDGLVEWCERKGFGTLAEVRGRLAVPADADADALARSGYVSAIESAKRVYGSLV